MKKQHLCGITTVLFGLLAMASLFGLERIAEQWHGGKPIHVVSGLLCTIGATQWVSYRRQQDELLGWPGWLRRLLFSSVLLLTGLSGHAQTTWTLRHQGQGGSLVDVAYDGTGRYVSVGHDGLIRVSTDGIVWATQVPGGSANDGLDAVVYAAGKFVTVGYNGRVLTSTDGLTWATQVSGTLNALNGIAYGAGRFIAVGDGGIAINSTDGVTWATLTTGTSVDLTDITYNGSLFAVVGDGGLVRTTPNGIIFTARIANTVADLRGVTVGSSGSFVAVGANSAIVTSANGITWVLQPVAGPAILFTSVAYHPVSGRYVAVSTTNDELATSADGITWTAGPSGTILKLYGVRHLDGRFIAVGDEGTIRSSPDGITWKPLMITTEMGFYGVAYGNGQYVVVGGYRLNPNLQSSRVSLAATSADGVNFALGDVPQISGSAAGHTLYRTTFGNGLFAAVGNDANVQTSADGKVWVSRYASLTQVLNDVAYGGGRFVAVGDVGLFVQSTDGITWTASNSGSSSSYSGVTYANGQFVAAGSSGGGGSIGTSTDGITWTNVDAGGSSLRSVAHGNGTYVAVGVSGTILRSADGVTWTSVFPFTAQTLTHLTFGNGQFVVIGQNGDIFTSVTGAVWDDRMSNSGGQALTGITHGNGLFVAVGYEATVVTSPDDGGVPPGNQPPVAPFIANTTGTVGQVYAQTIPLFTDPEGLPLGYSVTGLPPGLLVIAGGNISGPPTTAGVYPITVTATDPGGLSASASYTLTIGPAVVNPPVDPGSLTINAFTCHTTNNQLSSVDFVVGYANGTFLPALPHLFINGVTISGQLGQTYTLTFDTNAAPVPIQDNATRSTYFVWDFQQACTGGQPPLPTAPVVPGLPNQIATVGSFFSYVVPAFTGTGPITYSAFGLPAGLSFQASTRTISGVPTAVEAPTVAITAINAVGQHTGLFTITVSAAPANPPGNPSSLTITDYSCHYTGAVLSSVDFRVGYPGGLFTPAVPALFINGVTISGQLGQLYTFSFDANAAPLPIQDQASRSTYLVWNFQQACAQNGARLGPESLTPWQVEVLGNPVEEEVVVLITHAQGQSLHLELVDVAGHVVASRQVIAVSGQQREVLDVQGQGAGLLVLRVVGDTHRQTLKVLRR